MSKIATERNQRAVVELAALPGNGEFLQHSPFLVPCVKTGHFDRCLCRLQGSEPEMGILQSWDFHMVCFLVYLQVPTVF
jgi:hypothetical protein